MTRETAALDAFVSAIGTPRALVTSASADARGDADGGHRVAVDGRVDAEEVV